MNSDTTTTASDPLVVDLMWKTSGFEASLRLLVESARALLEARETRVGLGVTDEEAWTEALRHLHYDVVDRLLEYLPTLAGPWEVTDTKNRVPTRAIRIGYAGKPIAEVRKRGTEWTARVGDAFVEHAPEDSSASIFWPTFETAKSACDDRLIDSDVKLSDALREHAKEGES